MLQKQWKFSFGHHCPKLFIMQVYNQNKENGDVIMEFGGDNGTVIAKHMLEDKEMLSVTCMYIYIYSSKVRGNKTQIHCLILYLPEI